jgi:leucyl aminopeptidase
MDFKHLTSTSALTLASVAADALVVLIHGDAALADLDAELSSVISEAIEQGDFALKPGRTLYLHRPGALKANRVIISAAAHGHLGGFKSALTQALNLLKNCGARHVAIAPAGFGPMTAKHAHCLVMTAHEASYLYRHTKPSAAAAPLLKKFSLVCAKTESRAVQDGLTQAQAIAAGVNLAKECANRPANYCTPTFLAQQAKKLGKDWKLKVEILDKKEIEKIGMGAFLAVAQGSDEPLKFIIAKYNGAPKSQAPIVLVGKGITFDTGGISIKPATDMDEMKFDMGGAASVLGTLRAIAELKPAINLIGVIPACENMPSGRAVKPGDVVTSLSGQTIEILNTDAEGRLILCDALTYVERFNPAVVVDVATLTGACVIALGHQHTGMFSPNDAIAQQLLKAGQSVMDTCWRMPLDDEYEEGLKSNFADLANVGPRAGGSITAAMFLKKFTQKYTWAHLDIAGTAWRSGATKGATGRPVPLLTQFVLHFEDPKLFATDLT